MEKAKNVDEYISEFPKETQRKLQMMRDIIKKTIPLATETISYGIAAYKMHNSPVIYFAGFKNHIGVYPAPVNNKDFAEELALYKTGKGSVQFPLDKPIPQNLVKRIVKFRATENDTKQQAKKARSKPKEEETQTGNDKLNTYMAQLNEPEKETVVLLRDIIKKTARQLSERFKWSAPSYNLHGTDLVTFGPIKKGKVMLVFHHPAIIEVNSELLQGTYKDRRLMTFNDKKEIMVNKKELQRIIKQFLSAISIHESSS